jgi:hypothetical protein
MTGSDQIQDVWGQRGDQIQSAFDPALVFAQTLGDLIQREIKTGPKLRNESCLFQSLGSFFVLIGQKLEKGSLFLKVKEAGQDCVFSQFGQGRYPDITVYEHILGGKRYRGDLPKLIQGTDHDRDGL